MKPVLRLFFVVFMLVSLPAMAQGTTGVVISAGSGTARILVASETVPGLNARLTVAQNDLFGTSLASGVAAVTGVEGTVITVSLDTALQPGPVTIQIIEGEETAAGGEAGTNSAVGMSVGDLNPNFVIPGTGDGTPGENVAGPSGAEPGLDTVLPLVREWIAVAEPVENAEPGYNLKYSNWAQLYGSTPTGTITINAKPDDTGGLEYDMYLWTHYPDLPSLNHCTLKEFVLARIAGEPIDKCRGRHKAPPTFELADVTGQPVEAARQALAGKKLKVEVGVGGAAPSGTLENTVAAQAPGPGALVRGGQTVTLTVYGEYAVTDAERDRIEQAIAGCMFDEADGLIRAIDTDKARKPFSQRYDEAVAREEITKDRFGKADQSFRSCDYDAARRSLDEAAANTRCTRYQAQIDAAKGKISAAAAREAKTKALFSEADRLYRDKDYEAALVKLNQAKANTKCDRYGPRIDAAIAKAEGLVGQARTEPDASGAGPVATGSEIAGIWAFAAAACTGTAPPPRKSTGETPGTIGEAIAEGIAEGIEQALLSSRYRFAENGEFIVIGPKGESQVMGTWRLDGDTLTTVVDGKPQAATITERRADRMVFHDQSSGDDITLYRCAAASTTQEQTADKPSARADSPSVCADSSVASDGGLTGYNRIYGGGGTSIPMKGSFACTGTGTYWHVTEQSISKYRCEPDFGNCTRMEVMPVIKAERKNGSEVYWTSDSDWWVRSH